MMVGCREILLYFNCSRAKSLVQKSGTYLLLNLNKGLQSLDTGEGQIQNTSPNQTNFNEA